jgi:hypothetical protein
MTDTQLLREVFLTTFDAFAVDVSDIAQIPGVTNTRHARELLGVLVNKALVTEEEINNDGIPVWQAFETYDFITRDEAAAKFDAAFANPTQEVTTVNTNDTLDGATEFHTTPKGGHCLCGCGVQANAGRIYKPGHDARHVSKLVKATLAGQITKAEAHKQLPSAPLSYKYDNALANADANTSKRTRKTAKADPVVEATDPVKVGRWEYPGRKVDGKQERNTKRDGSGEWVTA